MPGELLLVQAGLKIVGYPVLRPYSPFLAYDMTKYSLSASWKVQNRRTNECLASASMFNTSFSRFTYSVFFCLIIGETYGGKASFADHLAEDEVLRGTLVRRWVGEGRVRGRWNPRRQGAGRRYHTVVHVVRRSTVLSPDNFLPIAEVINLFYELDNTPIKLNIYIYIYFYACARMHVIL
ncbi:hypothetical protein PUN28_018856 [Cardiocondyla obscurior]|uniref:Uncharacterized protein n=1 Tax=Cardiocondyla obscurior TaxID=286306 RepID=A0AAW2EED5_9HYME